jgi:hypothetical protein
MNENEPELRDGLRALAAEEPREAPSHVEQFLMGKFRARARRRRLALWGSAGAGIAAAVAIIGLMAWMNSTAVTQADQQDHVVVRTDDVAASFYPTPDADALAPIETAMVVRVQLPMSSLRLMGLPVSEDFSGDPIQADVLLGQDGLARGVRLIQGNSGENND